MKEEHNMSGLDPVPRPPVEPSGAGRAVPEPKRPKWLVPVIAGGTAVVVLAAGGIGGYLYWNHNRLTELDGGGEEVVVCLPDGTMPEGISDLELVRVPTRIEEGDAKTETMSDETAERMARTRFIVDEYTMGVLDEQDAGERLFRHLFPHWG